MNTSLESDSDYPLTDTTLNGVPDPTDTDDSRLHTYHASDADDDTDHRMATDSEYPSETVTHDDTNAEDFSDLDQSVGKFNLSLTDASIQHNIEPLGANNLRANKALTAPQRMPNCTPIDTLCETTESRPNSRVGDVNEDYSGKSGATHGEQESYSTLDSPIAWEAAANENQWLTVDMGYVRPLCGVITQAPKSTALLPEAGTKRVTAYSVDVSAASLQGPWSRVEEGKKFPGNLHDHSEEKVTNEFSQPVSARFVRVRVLEWQNDVAMRVGLLIPDGQCFGAGLD